MVEQFPRELEVRIVALESGVECGKDFDALSWLWLIIFGVLAPVGLLSIGWWGP